jgi:hypothetical protein
MDGICSYVQLKHISEADGTERFVGMQLDFEEDNVLQSNRSKAQNLMTRI